MSPRANQSYDTLGLTIQNIIPDSTPDSTEIIEVCAKSKPIPEPTKILFFCAKAKSDLIKKSQIGIFDAYIQNSFQSKINQNEKK